MAFMLSGNLASTIQRAQSAAQVPSSATCEPLDEAAQQPDFFSFRAQLQMAVARRDRAAVLAVTLPTIRTSFGPDDGIAPFMRDLANPRNRLWEELASVLALGGSFEHPDMFVAPYTFGCGEAFEDVVVIGNKVNVRAKPSLNAAVLAEANFDIFRGSLLDQNWAEVTLRDGRTGYVASRFIRAPTDYRAFFERIRGSWRLITFIAGD